MERDMPKRIWNRCLPSQVALRDEYLTNAFFLEMDYLLSMQEDRLLAGFRETAGLDRRGAVRYEGWENSLIGGHTMGHYLSACARACACADVLKTDREELRRKLFYLVDALTECQKNSRGKKGFLFGAVLTDPKHVEAQFDHVENGRTNIETEAWVPWYTMHKILAGLIDVYRYVWYAPALAAAEALGDWVCGRCLSWDEETRARVLSVEYGGMNDCLYELYAFTGEERYARAAHVFDEETLFARVISGEEDVLSGLHANTTIPKFIGALNRFRTLHGKTLGAETVDAGRYLEYAKGFFELVALRHTYITGGNSEWEHFGRDGILNAKRTNCNNETCNVYNMCKLAQELFLLSGEKKYLDFYERAFVNTILSSQHPHSGMTTYFQPMANGYFKVYAKPYDKFWCCVGSGMENFTRLNDGVYYVGENEITVALYVSSELSDEKMGITLTQRADPEHSDSVRLILTPQRGRGTKPLTLKLRIPDWAAEKPRLYRRAEDGKRESLSYRMEDGYAVVSGSFLSREELEFTLKKKLTAESLPDAPEVAGFLYGPFVLSADLGTKAMKETTTGVCVTVPAERSGGCDTLILPEGETRAAVMEQPERFFLREDGEPLSFRFRGTPLVFAPHYRKYKSRYGIYFQLLSAKEAARATPRAAERTVTVDTVQPGYGQYENDALHRMRERGSRGITSDGTCRYALAGGFFSYRMAVCPECGNFLEIRLKKKDNGRRLAVAAGESVLFDGRLSYHGDDEEYVLRFDIPREELARAERIEANGEEYRVVEICFRGAPDEPGARVCGFIHMKYDGNAFPPL